MRVFAVAVVMASGMLHGCVIAGLVAAAGYAASAGDEAEARQIEARAAWERMNLEREQAGLAPLPYPEDYDEMSPEDKARGREQWERMNERRKAEGKDELPMPEAYEIKKS